MEDSIKTYDEILGKNTLDINKDTGVYCMYYITKFFKLSFSICSTTARACGGLCEVLQAGRKTVPQRQASVRSLRAEPGSAPLSAEGPTIVSQ